MSSTPCERSESLDPAELARTAHLLAAGLCEMSARFQKLTRDLVIAERVIAKLIAALDDAEESDGPLSNQEYDQIDGHA